MCSTTITTSAVDHDGGTPITAVHPDIIQSLILNRLDGPTLASTSCASTQLLSLCTDDHLWREICNATWPSTTHPTVRAAISDFPSGHRSFYSDSFPRASASLKSQAPPPETSELISAVDIFYGDELLYSKVFTTETLSGWFLSSPFRAELFDPKEEVPTPLKFDGEDGACMSIAEDRLRVSWVLIDPRKNRAVDIASVKAVDARRHWLTEDVELRYATVVCVGEGEAVQVAVVVKCGGKEGGELRIKEVSMQVEDLEGRILTGLDSLRVLDAAMEGRRRRSDGRMARDAYEMFVGMKIRSRERKQRRERNLDMVCVAAGVSLFLAFWTFFLSR